MKNKRKLQKKQILIFSLTAAILLACWIYWGNTAIQVTEYEIIHRKLNPDFPGITVAQISDLHNTEFGKNQETLTAKLEEISPDLIAVTGDLIDSNRRGSRQAAEFLYAAAKIAPVYYVSGNHEAWDPGHFENIKEELLSAGGIFLDGRSEILSLDGQKICLMGAADPSFSEASRVEGEPEAMRGAIGQLPADRSLFTLLLSHRPELFDVYVETEMDLILTGHAHGGQFRLPLLGGVIAPNQGLFPKYSSGMFHEKTTRMIVSRGLGNSVVPIRIFNRPEIVVIQLKPERK